MSERTVYAIASGKGGVGKTTTAINLGAMLADRDHEVVVVDTDLGMANLADFLDFEIGTPTLHEVLAGDADFEAAVARAPGGIDVLPSGTDIEAFARSNPANLRHVVADLRAEYDYVLLDTGAGVSYDTLVPLALADGVLLVATPDVASVRDTAKTGELAERVESEVAGAVLTQHSNHILDADDVEETLGTDVLAVVPEDEAVPMGIDAGRPLAAFAPNAPAGRAYRSLAEVLTGETAPDPELALDAETERDDEDAPEPDDPTKATDVAVDAVSDRELAESVRDAVEDGATPEKRRAGGDPTGGLLGGQLASAADEIRKQAAESAATAADDRESEAEGDGATESESGPEASGDETATEAFGSETTTETKTATEDAASADADETADEGDQVADADETTESEARSVEDLINEHIGDERLGEDDSTAEEAGDPSAETGEELAEEDDGDPLDAGDDALDDPLGGADADSLGVSDADSASDADDEAASVSGIPFDRDEPESASDGRTATDRDAGAESDAETEFETELGRDAGTDRDGTVGPDDESDDDSNGGVLGRLGSLFK